MSMIKTVGLLGATSHVGLALLRVLQRGDYQAIAFSRQITKSPLPLPAEVSAVQVGDSVRWSSIESLPTIVSQQAIAYWISLAPIWVLLDYLDQIQKSGAQRIVVLSSTSRFTKQDSSTASDKLLALRFIDAEAKLQAWAEEHGIQFVILRPTLIYGLGKDKNICEIARLIRRFRFFPLLGEGKGLRQPVHCHDVAQACANALVADASVNKSYNLSGDEVLSYKNMVTRVFETMKLKPRFFNVPMFILQASILLIRLIPRYRSWSFAMIQRMNKDMIFDHQDAERDLGFKPRKFILHAEDLP